MLNGKKILAVIPARGGSRRVPYKNLCLFRIGDDTKTLLEWAIETAKKSKYLDDLYVSTEDERIALAAEKAKASVIRRPHYLASDKSPTEAVLVHALYMNPGYDFAVILQPTSPLRTTEDIDRCIEVAVNLHGVNQHTGCVSYNLHDKRNGAVYVCNVEHFLEFLSFDAAHHYEMPNERSLDIDYSWDFKGHAESAMALVPVLGADDKILEEPSAEKLKELKKWGFK